MGSLQQDASSYRDPAGFVYKDASGTVLRQVNQAGKNDYDLLMSSGLYKELADAGLLIPHKEITVSKSSKDAYKTLKPENIPFITYPYEWSFSQLKDAALLTLKIQEAALRHGMILKDASAYNVQFIGKQPVFIDTLSFAQYTPGEPWEGYRQFCEHFIAPLAVARYSTLESLKFLRSNLEGVSLELAASLLPKRARLNGGLLSHIFLHNASQKRYQNVASDKGVQAATKRQVSKFALDGLIGSLENTTKRLKPPHYHTEWGDYYTFTNYSEEGFTEKRTIIGKMLDSVKSQAKIAWDMGANNGEFSILAAERGLYTVAMDIDPLAVERDYRMEAKEQHQRLMLPVVQDCVNPSPDNGLLGQERQSLNKRGPADVVMALALIHHLAIGRNIPLSKIAEMFAGFGKYLIIEFVPKGDSKVDILLASRKDIFTDYNEEQMEQALSKHFKLLKKAPIKHTKRTLYLYEKTRA